MTIRTHLSRMTIVPERTNLAELTGRWLLLLPRRGDSQFHTVAASADTREEAEQAKRAFEQVLAPRFTRDEAIAIVLETMPEPVDQACEHYLRGIRLALEALAAAGAFSDGDVVIRDQSGNGNDLVQRPTMSDKLDAAGIR